MNQDYYDYYYDDDEDRNIRISSINTKDNNNNLIKINSTTMRISVLEDRTKSLEKMLRLFEERLNLKEEEKLSDIKNIESSTAIINKLNKKIKHLEKQLKDYITLKQISDQENTRVINELTQRIKILEGNVSKKGMNNTEDSQQNEKETITNEKNSKIILNDFNEMIKSNNLQIDEYLQDKIDIANIDNENKMNELLNLMHDINKIVEENENKINLLFSDFNKIQKDNLNVIQMVSIQEEKINNVDYIIEEIKSLKTKYNEIASILDDKNEEEKFTKEFLKSVKDK